jgi:gluconolactonase
VVKSDGSIWFTDPPFGLLSWYEGRIAPQEAPMNVYRVDADGAMTVVEGEVNRPNGLCFSPDESLLYLVESGTSPRNVYVYDVTGGGKRLGNRRKFIDVGAGTPDGMRCDTDGNLWMGWGMGDAAVDGVNVYNPDGRLIGRVALPERCANLCFGGLHRNRLFMAASKSVYALYVNAQGAVGG